MSTNNPINNKDTDNFTVTSSSTTPRNLTVQQTATSGNSNAATIISVAGDTAFDPYERFEIGTTASYSLGIDNSDSNKLKLTYSATNSTPSAGTELLIANSDGIIQTPNNVMFRVYLNVAKTDVSGGGANYLLKFDTKNYDIGTNYSTSTGLFTAPVAGKYLFFAMIRLSGLNSGGYDVGGPQLVKNSTVVSEYTCDFSNIKDSSNQLSVALYDFQDMAANDTMAVHIKIDGEDNELDIAAGTSATYFGGILIA